MPSRKTLLHLAAKTALLFAALFIVSVLLAAIPAHRSPLVQGWQQQSGATPTMPVVDPEQKNTRARQAASDRTPGRHHHHNLPRTMPAKRRNSP